jgi:hypothetical protein
MYVTPSTHISFYICKTIRVTAMFIIVITHCQVTITKDCRTLTNCMNLRYVVGHKRTSSPFFHCIVSVILLLIVLSRVRSFVTNNNGFWIGFTGTSITITITLNYSRLQQLTI